MIPGRPADWMLRSIVAVVRERLVGRSFTVRIGSDADTGRDTGPESVELTLREIQAAPDTVGLLVGRLDDVRLVAEDVLYQGRRIERVRVVCHAVTVRPGLGFTVTAAPVTVEATVADADLSDWLTPPSTPSTAATPAAPGPRVWIGEDGVLRATRRGAARIGHLELDCVLGSGAEAGTLRFTPRAVVAFGRRIPAGWLPPRTVRPRLPDGTRLLAVGTAPRAAVLRLEVDRWQLFDLGALLR